MYTTLVPTMLEVAAYRDELEAWVDSRYRPTEEPDLVMDVRTTNEEAALAEAKAIAKMIGEKVAEVFVVSANHRVVRVGVKVEK